MSRSLIMSALAAAILCCTAEGSSFRGLLVANAMRKKEPPVAEEWWSRTPQPIVNGTGGTAAENAANAFPWPLGSGFNTPSLNGGWPTNAVSAPDKQWRLAGFVQTVDANFVRGTATADPGACAMRSPLLGGIGHVGFRLYTGNAAVAMTCTVQTSEDGVEWKAEGEYTTQNTSLSPVSFSVPVNDARRLFVRFLLSRPAGGPATAYGFLGDVSIARFGEPPEQWWTRRPQPIAPGTGGSAAENMARAFPWPGATLNNFVSLSGGYPGGRPPEEQWKLTGVAQGAQAAFVRASLGTGLSTGVMESPYVVGAGAIGFHMFTSDAGVPVTCTIQVSADGKDWETVGARSTQSTSASPAHFSVPVNDARRLCVRFTLSRPAGPSSANAFLGHINIARPGE